ncbi:MAG TPA: SRPBCC family protein [bacterium]|nr:SRPBCC family protein [bacterium]
MKGKWSAMFLMGASLALMAGCEAKRPAEAMRLTETIMGSTVIEAPPEKVWSTNWGCAANESDGTVTCERWPGFIMKNLRNYPEVGGTYDWTWDWEGRKYSGQAMRVMNVANKMFVEKMTGDMDWTMTTITAPHERGTRIIELHEYTMDVPPGMSSEQFGEELKKYCDNATAVAKKNIEKAPDSKEAVAALAAKMEVSSLSDTTMAGVEIAAPPEAVFSYLTDPAHFAEWEWSQNSNYQGRGLGETWDWSIEIAGQKLGGHAMVVDYLPGQKWAVAWNGDFHGTDTWLFVPAGAGTRLSFIQYAATVGPHMTRTDWDSIVQANRKDIEQTLQKIKARLEK